MHFIVSNATLLPSCRWEHVYPPNARSPNCSANLGSFTTVLDSGTLNVADPTSNIANTTAPSNVTATTPMSGADHPHGKQHNAIFNMH